MPRYENKKEIEPRSDQFLFTLWCNELFYHDMQISLHNADSSRIRLTIPIISLVLKPHVVLRLSCHCNMIKAFIRVLHVALRQLIMMLLVKQFTELHILFIMKFEKTGHRRVFYKFHKSLTPAPLW